MSAIRTKRNPTVAQDWQLAVLKKLHSESENPTEEQRRAVVAATGLDDKWIRSWFTRQRFRSRKGQSSTTSSPMVSTFRIQLYYPPTLPAKHRSQTAISPQSSAKATTPPFSGPPTSHTISTYSRDPLRDRYPDFSQFFRSCAFELPDTKYNTSMHLLANPNTDTDTSLHPQGSSDPLLLGDLAMDLGSSTCLPSFPVAFSMRLVDLLRCS